MYRINITNFSVTKTGLFKVLRYSLLLVFYKHCKITMKLENSERPGFFETDFKRHKV